MSDVADSAIVRLLLSDYAAGDAANKINILGAGMQVSGYDPTTGATVPFAVVVEVTFAPEHVGESTAVELVLEDSHGNPVVLPGLAGPMGEPQTMSIGQAHQIEEPHFPGMNVPRRALRPRLQLVLNFANGLPLAVGQLYVWRVKIDHTSPDHWTERFYVPGPPPAPVFGGGTGPADLPRTTPS